MEEAECNVADGVKCNANKASNVTKCVALEGSAVVTKEILYRFGALLAAFITLNLQGSIAVPLGIEAEILQRRLQRKARPEGERLR